MDSLELIMIFKRLFDLVDCGESKAISLPRGGIIRVEGLDNCIKISYQSRLLYTIHAFTSTSLSKSGSLVYSNRVALRCGVEEFGEFFPKRYDTDSFLEEIKKSCPQFFEWMIWNLL